VTVQEIHDATDEKIARCLAFCETLQSQCRQHGKSDKLPEHLQREKDALIAERDERLRLAHGGGI
jgi:hypothetical protein